MNPAAAGTVHDCESSRHAITVGSRLLANPSHETFMTVKPILASLLLALGAGAAQAHQVWIEQPANGSAVLRFGEFGENLRETSPGLLDKFGKPTALRISSQGQQPLTATKSANGFVLSGRAAAGESLVAEDARYPLYSMKQGDKEIKGWYHPAARYLTTTNEQAPSLTFDVVPTGKSGEFKVVFKGQPLPKAKVSAVVQSGWMKEAVSDQQGLVTFDMPWKGTYVLEAHHDDRTAGERMGDAGAEKYDVVNYVTSVTYAKPTGTAAVPAGPAAKPGK